MKLSALMHGINALVVFVSEISLVHCVHSFHLKITQSPDPSGPKILVFENLCEISAAL